MHAKRKTRSEAFLAETDVTSTAYSKDVELFRNGSVHVDYFGTSEHISVVEKKKNLYKQNFSETSMVRLTGRALQVSLVISMQFF